MLYSRTKSKSLWGAELIASFSICSLLKVFVFFFCDLQMRSGTCERSKGWTFLISVHDIDRHLKYRIACNHNFVGCFFSNLPQLLQPVRQSASSLSIRELQENKNSNTKSRPLSATDTLGKKQIQLVGEEATAPQRHFTGLQSSNAINS